MLSTIRVDKREGSWYPLSVDSNHGALMQTQRPNPLAALLGRPASSFTVEQLDALPQHTAFGRPDLFGEGDLERLAYASNGDGRWCSAVGPVDSATLRKITGLVCIAVGEPPEVLGIERAADDALRALLPLSPLPLGVVVSVDAVPASTPAASVYTMLEVASIALDEWIRTGSEAAHKRAVEQMDAATAAIKAARR